MQDAWADFDSADLSEAEKKLIEACKAGELCVLGDGTRPEGAMAERRIRAEVLRLLILGTTPDGPTHEWGVKLGGAYITGDLDLSFGTERGATGLFRCRMDGDLDALQSRFELLSLKGTSLKSLNAQGAQIKGAVFLNGDFEAEGEVSLSGARIGGQLACEGGTFQNPDGHAIDAQDAEIKGSVFLSNGFTVEGEVSLSGAQIGVQLACGGGKFQNPNGHAINAQGSEIKGDVFLSNDFAATGEVRLSGARIGGQLDCTGGTFQNPNDHAIHAQGAEIKGGVFLSDGFAATGEVSLSGSQIGGQLDCDGGTFQNPNGHAINAQRMTVAESFIFRGVTIDAGSVYLASAHVGGLVDDLSSWPEGGRVILDGFTYDKISASFVDSARCLDWLARGDTWGAKFFPQPYGQLARVLRDMGHERAAKDVLVARERKIAAEEWARAQSRSRIWSRAFGRILRARFSSWMARLSHALIDFGHRPLKALWWLVGLWIIATALAQWAWVQGDMVPNSDVILTSQNWAAIHAATHPADSWADTPEGQGWESFSSLAWGLDLVIPILDLGQTEAWSASKNHGDAGKVLWIAKPLLSSFGWIILAFAAAGATGVARRD